MDIKVRLHGVLQHYRPKTLGGEVFALDVPEHATVEEVGRQLGLPETWVCLTFVNGEACRKNQQLRTGDLVAFLPPARGGTLEF